MNKSAKLGWKNWLSIILIGFIGQIAWAIENQYINLWVYSQSQNAEHITWMTMASAVAATLTTFFMGALSDRLGKRKIFIAGGYVAWGVSVFLFGLMSRSNMEWMVGAGSASLMVGIMNTVVDCVMTFFGSTSNDACFNAHVTDVTNEHNRPKVESILSVMPLFAVVAMIGIGYILGLPGDGTASAKDIAQPWFYFFLIFGVLTTVIGIAAFFIIPKDDIAPNRDEPYFKNLIYGFRPSTIKKAPLFYIALLSFMFFNIATDAFMPYYLVYFQKTLGMGNDQFIPAMGIIMGVASLLVILVGLFMDKIGKLKLLIPSIVIMFAGALIFFFVTSYPWVVFAGCVLMFGYLIGTAVLGAELRDQTPVQDVGLFQGVRMVFAVMLPMIIGSNVSLWCFQSTYINDYGETTRLPDKWMFLVVAVSCLLAIAPALWLIIKVKKTPVAPTAIPVQEPENKKAE